MNWLKSFWTKLWAEGPQKRASLKPGSAPTAGANEPVNLKLRYDVYCVERGEKLVVYRNAQFKASRMLFGPSDYPMSDFVELEQQNGQTVFVAKSSIVKFCQHGVRTEGEGVE